MKPKKNIFNLKLSFLIVIFSLFTLTACGECGSVPKEPKSKDNTKTINSPDLKKVIVLLHGLASPADQVIAELGNKLRTDIKNSEIVILNRYNSCDVSTTQQAEETYVALKKELEEKKLIDSPICLFGDSHGGLVAIELYHNHKKDLNIAGIITNHSPLEGIPALTVSNQAVEDLKTALKNVFSPDLKQLINTMLVLNGENTTIDKYLEGLDLKTILTQHVKKVVVDDLTQNSPFLQNIKSILGKIQIPILILGGRVDIKTALLALLQFAAVDGTLLANGLPYFKQILYNILANSSKLKDLEAAFGTVIGDKREGNDCFVPYYSQMAQSLLDYPNVERFGSRDYHHFYSTAQHKLIYNKLVGFINQVFEAKK